MIIAIANSGMIIDDFFLLNDKSNCYGKFRTPRQTAGLGVKKATSR